METKFIKKAGFYLYSDAEGAKLNILIKPNEVATRNALRRSYMEKYASNKDRYGRRKLGERPFGNADLTFKDN